VLIEVLIYTSLAKIYGNRDVFIVEKPVYLQQHVMACCPQHVLSHLPKEKCDVAVLFKLMVII